MEKKKIKRIPRNYEGVKPTGRHIGELLPNILDQLGDRYREGGDLVLQAWPKIIGDQLAPMAKAKAFESGILKVKVSNATLLSVLQEHEKSRLLSLLRKELPSLSIKNIVFSIG